MPGATEDEETVCPSFTPFQAIGTATHDAVRSNIGQAATPIDVWNRCRYVDNNSADKSAFVPFKSEPEWQAFITGYPSFMSVATCARPTTMNLAPNSDCADPSPASLPVSLPYARTGTVITKSTAFACAPPEEGCPGWTQTVQADFTALNSDVTDPSWSAGSPTYLGEPLESECAQPGLCGSAHAVPVSSTPSTGLCSEGLPSTVTGSGPWSWTCAGSGGGETANCTAPLSGTCGPAQGVAVSSAPATGLCTTGSPSTVTGSGPWNWTCAGSGGGATDNCSAPKLQNGGCGPANGATAFSKPTSGLCSAGTPSTVTGSGPWNWTCAGSGGGTTASCSAYAACPAPAENAYFVLSAGSWNGNLGGIAGANAKCLADLQANDWLGKSGTTLNSATVKAFLCKGADPSSMSIGYDSAGVLCNNLQPNARYRFAVSGDPSVGGGTMLTQFSGFGNAGSANWNGASRFGGTYTYWSYRHNGWPTMTDSRPYIGDGYAGNDCNRWTSSSSSLTTYGATSNSTTNARWLDGTAPFACNTSRRLICVVHNPAASAPTTTCSGAFQPGKSCNTAQMCGDAVYRSPAPASQDDCRKLCQLWNAECCYYDASRCGAIPGPATLIDDPASSAMTCTTGGL